MTVRSASVDNSGHQTFQGRYFWKLIARWGLFTGTAFPEAREMTNISIALNCRFFIVTVPTSTIFLNYSVATQLEVNWISLGSSFKNRNGFYIILQQQ